MKRVLYYLLMLAVFVGCQKVENQNVIEQSLDKGWTLTGDTLSINSLPVTVPSVVQQSLYEAGMIPHPYLGTVENDLLWISDHPWNYTLQFDVRQDLLQMDAVELVFDGIDTYAEVILNGQKLFFADNQFRSWKSEVKSLLNDSTNLLEVNFVRYDSRQRDLYEQAAPRFPEKYAVSRKAPYQHGWDWAPKYKNVGIWKPVKLVGWNKARLEGAYMVTKTANPDSAQMMLHLDLNSSVSEVAQVELFVNGFKTNEIVVGLQEGQHHKALPVTLKNPHLWWPNGMGDPSMSVVVVCLKQGEKMLDTKSFETGVRTFEMVDEPDNFGRAFYFKVNGVPFYAKGANYVPEEMIETWMDDDHTLNLIRAAKEANFNMLRVWGGGVYPSDDFFNICDSLGILVWEDFMYAGTMYPYDEAFLKNAETEAVEQVKRLASHPSLALWCGGNEISEGYYNWGWQKSLGWSKADDQAIKAGYDRLFEDILPKAVAEFDGTRPYWPSSPSKGWGRPESLTEGDVHYWGVWWGEQPFEAYRNKVGRFNSEYGYQSYPDYSTLKNIAQGAVLNKDAKVIAAHQKHPRGTRQIDDFIRKYYPYSTDFEWYVYLSQLSQAYGMEIAIEAHRTAKPYNMGTLYWQLNDAWPVTSWSSIDYYGNKKALQYKLKTLYAPVLLSLDPKDYGVFVTSDLIHEMDGTLKVEVADFDGKVWFEKSTKVQIAENGNEKVMVEDLHKFLTKSKKDMVYVKLTLSDNKNEVLAERLCYLVIPKNLKLPKADVELEVKKVENGQVVIKVSSDVFAKDVQVFCTNCKGQFSDNFFDLEPRKTKQIIFIPSEKQENFDFSVRSL